MNQNQINSYFFTDNAKLDNAGKAEAGSRP